MAVVYLSAGSNIGNRERNLQNMFDGLRDFSTVLSVSAIYETSPVGFQNQPLFLNLAVCIETELAPRHLMSSILVLEERLGRKRNERNGPRIIDIDIIFYNGLTVDQEGLEIPHPRYHLRQFVLAPLNDLCPDKICPRQKQTVSRLLTQLKTDETVVLHASRLAECLH